VALVLAYSRIGWFGSWLASHGIQILFSPIGIVMATMAVSLPLRAALGAAGLDRSGQGPGRRRAHPGRGSVSDLLAGDLAGDPLGRPLRRNPHDRAHPRRVWRGPVVSGNITGKTQTLPIYIFDAWDQNFDTIGSFAGALVLASISIVALIILSTLRARERSCMSISLSHLTKRYGADTVVDDVTVEIPRVRSRRSSDHPDRASPRC